MKAIIYKAPRGGWFVCISNEVKSFWTWQEAIAYAVQELGI